MASSVVYQRKRALIIGINRYPRNPLKYCVNDATDLQTTLERMNFQISSRVDCNLRDFYTIIDTFAETVQRDDLVLFYFAGHGKQNEDENYLLPSDYDYDHRGHERDYIVNHAINIKYIMKKIDDTKCRVTIYLFDCCRNLVRTRSDNMSQGLLPMHAPLQTLVVFACAPGKAVQDETRNNRNGSFIENLLKYITTPNRDAEEIMKDVACAVHLQTDGFQLPYRTSSLTNKVFLVTNNNQGQCGYFSCLIDLSSLVGIGIDHYLTLGRLSLDPQYDRDFTDIVDRGERLTRGSLEYHRPYGWKRYAIKVVGKYEDEVWLGSNNSPNEWPVSYHGTGHDAATSIAQSGYNLTKHKRFTYGYGIYTTPEISMAILYARSFIYNGQEYLVVLQNRVNPRNVKKTFKDENGVGEFWLSPTEADIRPYAICIKKK